jgi:DinB superfamily
MPEIPDYLSKAFLERQGISLDEVLKSLRLAQADFASKLERASLYEAVSAGKWTPAKISDHLSTSNAFFAACLERAINGKTPIKMPKGQLTDDGRPINPGQEPRANQTLSDLQQSHQVAFEALERYAKKLETLELLETICVTQSFFGELTTLEVLRLCAWHTRHHAAQIPTSSSSLEL